MSGNAAMSTDERELLAELRRPSSTTASGARSSTSPTSRPAARIASSALSVGGLVKHAAQVQVGWRLMIEAAPGEPVWPGTLEEQQANYERDNTWLEGDTVPAVLAAFDDEAERVLAAIRAADLDTPVPVPQDVPWFPKDVSHWSVRWVVLHLIEELARHAGHADLLREADRRRHHVRADGAARGLGRHRVGVRPAQRPGGLLHRAVLHARRGPGAGGDLHLHPAPAVHAPPRRLQLGPPGAARVVALGDRLAALPAPPPGRTGPGDRPHGILTEHEHHRPGVRTSR